VVSSLRSATQQGFAGDAPQLTLRFSFRARLKPGVGRNVDLGLTKMEEGTMADLRITTTRGTDTVLDEATVQGFKTNLRGLLLCPGDDGYDEARTIWNAMIVKRPALIVRCAGVADVINTVNFARTNNLLVAVRGGGHSFPGHSICDGGLMIDLSQMKSIRVDPLRRTARAEPGVKLGEFDHETQAFNLATTAGVVSDTGIAGLTLGGGMGWLARKYGLSCDNLLSVDIVTADGRFLTASATANEDLFWGVRGGGGNFGIITSFEYRLHPVGSMVLGGFVMHPVSKAKEVLKFYKEFSGSAPDELTTLGALLYSPEGEPVVSIGGCYHGPLDVGEQVIRPLKEYGPPIADTMGPMPYTAVQRMFDQVPPPGWRYYAKAGFITGLGGDAIDILADHFATVPSRSSFILVFQLGGAVSRVPKDQTAWSHRDAVLYHFEVISVWQDPADDEKNVRWARELWDAFMPFTSGGVSVNHLGDEGQERVLASYGAETYHRLASLKKKYDPTNLFRLNQNIKPTA